MSGVYEDDDIWPTPVTIRADDLLRAPWRVEGVAEGVVLLPAVAYRCRKAGMADDGGEPRPRRTGRRLRARRTRNDPDGGQRCDRQKRSYASSHENTPFLGIPRKRRRATLQARGQSCQPCRPAIQAAPVSRCPRLLGSNALSPLRGRRGKVQPEPRPRVVDVSPRDVPEEWLREAAQAWGVAL